jgi:histidyl-tRNA synthetase
MAFERRGIKSQLREANKRNARYAVILGSEEIKSGQATVRDMAQGQQDRVPLGELVEWLSARVGRT